MAAKRSASGSLSGECEEVIVFSFNKKHSNRTCFINMSGESLYSETQCTVGNGHMGRPLPPPPPPRLWTEWQGGHYTTFP